MLAPESRSQSALGVALAWLVSGHRAPGRVRGRAAGGGADGRATAPTTAAQAAWPPPPPSAPAPTAAAVQPKPTVAVARRRPTAPRRRCRQPAAPRRCRAVLDPGRPELDRRPRAHAGRGRQPVAGVRPPDHVRQQLKPQPMLAESWDVAPDFKQIKFNLRKGVTCHTGREFTSDDVKWNLLRVRSRKRPPASTPARATGSTTIETPDKYTVILKSESSRPAAVRPVRVPEHGRQGHAST